MEEISRNGWALLHKGQPVHVGDSLTDLHGECREATGGAEPHKLGASGRVHARKPGTQGYGRWEFAPSEVGCEWVKQVAPT